MASIKEFFTEVSKSLFEQSKENIETRSLTKGYLIKELDDRIEGHDDFVSAVRTLTQKQAYALMEQFKENVDDSKYDRNMRELYDDLTNQYFRQSSQLEVKAPLSPLLMANAAMSELMKDVRKNVDEFFDETDRKGITIKKVKFSVTTLLTLLQHSDTLYKYSINLFRFIMSVVDRDEIVLPKIQQRQLLKNTKAVGMIVTQMCNRTGMYDFLKAMKVIKAKNLNPLMYNSDPRVTSAYVSNYVPPSIAAIASIFQGIGMFFAMPVDAYEKYKQTMYELRKENKQWLERRVALFRLRMSDMNENSPEYQKYAKWIEKHEATINEYSELIDKYERQYEG